MMRISHKMGLLSIAAVFCCGLALPSDSIGQEAGWDVGVRKLPPPAAVSKELHDSIKAAAAPDVEASKQSAPKTEEQWKATIGALAAGGTPLETMEKQNGVTITPYEVEGVPVYYVVPEKPNPAHADHVFIHVHGGGYVFGGGDSCAGEASVIAGRIGIQVLSIDYRMPPEFPFPAAVIDVVTVYKELIEKTPPKQMAIGGTSAGGGLALAFVHQLKSLGMEVPGAIYAGTPWADLTITSDSLFTNEGVDRVLVTPHGMLKSMADLYAGNRNKKNPMISPVYGEFEGFPPTYLITGTRDMLLSDTVRVHRKLRRAGVDADLHVYEGMSHAGYLYVQDSPESREVFEELDAFLQKHLK